MGTTHKLTKPHNIATATALLASGAIHQEVADTVGVSRSRVTQFANKDHIKQLITQAQERLITDNAQLVLDNQHLKIKRANDVLKDDRVDLEANKTLLSLADKAETRIGQVMGIMPSHTVNQFITQIFDQSQTIYSSEVLGLISGGSALVDEVIDVDLGLDDDVSGEDD